MTVNEKRALLGYPPISEDERCDWCGHPIRTGTHGVPTKNGVCCTVSISIDPARIPRMDIIYGTVHIPTQPKEN